MRSRLRRLMSGWTPGRGGSSRGRKRWRTTLEHLLFTGTPTRPAETDVDGAIEDLGGSLDAATSYDWAHFYTVVPSSSFDGALERAGGRLAAPGFGSKRGGFRAPDYRIRDSGQQRRSRDVRRTNDARRAVRRREQPTGRRSPARSRRPTPCSAYTVADFYHDNYRPSRVTVVVAGDVAPDEVTAAVAKAFGGWKEPNPAVSRRR